MLNLKNPEAQKKIEKPPQTKATIKMSTTQSNTKPPATTSKSGTQLFLDKCKQSWSTLTEEAVKKEKEAETYLTEKKQQITKFISGVMPKDASDPRLKVPQTYVLSGSAVRLMIDVGTIITMNNNTFPSFDSFLKAQNGLILVPQDITVELSGSFPPTPTKLTLARVLDGGTPANTTAVSIGEFSPEHPVVYVSTEYAHIDPSQNQVGSASDRIALVGGDDVARFHYRMNFAASALVALSLIVPDMTQGPDGNYKFLPPVVTPIVIVPMKSAEPTVLKFQSQSKWKTHSQTGTSSLLSRIWGSEDTSLVTLIFASPYFAQQFGQLCQDLSLGGSVITSLGKTYGFYLMQSCGATNAMKYLDQVNDEFFASSRKAIVVSFQGPATFNQNQLHANVLYDGIPLNEKDDRADNYPHFAVKPTRDFQTGNEGWSSITDIIRKSQDELSKAFGSVEVAYEKAGTKFDPSTRAQSLIADFLATNEELARILTAATLPFTPEDHVCTKNTIWPPSISNSL